MTLSFEEFENADYVTVASIAPETLIFAVSGTRRSAALSGHDVNSDDYARWSRKQMIDACALIFRHGVRNIFTVLATPGQFNEVGPYREQLLDWIEWGTVGPDACQDYLREEWQVRLINDGSEPIFDELDRKLQSLTPTDGRPTLWYVVVQDRETLWMRVLGSIVEAKALTVYDAIRAVYGSSIAPASLYLGFGKPTIAPELLPPLMMDVVDCYWSQIPGYHLTERSFRSILYDHRYLRNTWTSDKASRDQQIVRLDQDWTRSPILGLGSRVGPFWFPIWANELGDPPMAMAGQNKTCSPADPRIQEQDNDAE